MLAAILIISIGLIMAWKPHSIPNIHHILFEDGNLSESYYVVVRITGLLAIFAGVIILALLFSE